MIKFIPEKLFLFLALFFGLLYVFIIPPFQSVDEGAHFFRAYQISSGKFLAKNINSKIGDYLPKALINYYDLYHEMIKNIDVKTNFYNIKRDLDIKVNNNELQFVQFANTSLYSPLCYIGELPGILIGKFLNLPIALVFYLGRICNLFFYCILVYYAIKNIPFFKLPLFLLALMPMSLSIAASHTSDVIVLGLNFLWISYILKIIVSDIQISKKNIAVLTLLSLLISFSKSYVLLLFLIFLIPKSKFKNIKIYIKSIVGIFLIGILGSLIWFFCIKGLTINMNPLLADPDMQLQFIKSNPILYIWIMIKTFFVKTPRFIITMIGVLGWQDTRLDFITYVIYPILMYFAIMSENYVFKLEKWQKIIIWLTVILGTIFAYTSLYLMWTPVKNGIILGLNGKYFIPLIFPFLILFKNNKYDLEKYNFLIIFMIILILFSSELSLLHRFYDLTPNLYYKV